MWKFYLCRSRSARHISIKTDYLSAHFGSILLQTVHRFSIAARLSLTDVTSNCSSGVSHRFKTNLFHRMSSYPVRTAAVTVGSKYLKQMNVSGMCFWIDYRNFDLSFSSLIGNADSLLLFVFNVIRSF